MDINCWESNGTWESKSSSEGYLSNESLELLNLNLTEMKIEAKMTAYKAIILTRIHLKTGGY